MEKETNHINQHLEKYNSLINQKNKLKQERETIIKLQENKENRDKKLTLKCPKCRNRLFEIAHIAYYDGYGTCIFHCKKCDYYGNIEELI